MRPFALTLALAAMAACAPKPDDSGASPAPAPSASILTPPGTGQGGVFPLAGAPWRLAALTGAEIPATIPEVQHPTIEFSDAGRAAGKAGVNRWTGGYVRGDGDAITFTPGAMTRMAGLPEAMELEDKYVKMLTAVKRWRLATPASLELLDASGAVLARFTR